MMRIKAPYLLFLGDGDRAKTASGVHRWRPDRCLAQMRLPGCSVDLGLPDMAVQPARAAGAETLLLGTAPAGGQLPEAWVGLVAEALLAGLDVASGLHVRLSDVPQLRRAAEASGRRILDVRHPNQTFSVGSGTRRPGRRVLTVGTDCGVGKMFTSLAIEQGLRAQGADVDFRATGQTGILIAGSGVAVDAVVADFIAGAAEWLAPAAADAHWDVIEGQGSLFHPAFAGVTLGLLHGSQAQDLVLCHEAGRARMLGFADFAVPSLGAAVALYEQMAQRTCPEARVVGISLNTASLSEPEAGRHLRRAAEETGLPCVDPLRSTGAGRTGAGRTEPGRTEPARIGVSPLVDALLSRSR